VVNIQQKSRDASGILFSKRMKQPTQFKF